MSITRKTLPSVIATVIVTPVSAVTCADTEANTNALEEVIVISQRREQRLQEIPLSVSVLNNEQLQLQGIAALADLGSGAIPSLRVKPFGNTPSNLVMVMRGNGPFDASEVSREPSIATYLDGIYLGRTQGLGLELMDPERIEVAKGPQGTLFGRNAIGGAVNVVSKKPTGEFGFEQTFRKGTYDEFRSVTRINLPEIAGIKTKIDYLHSKRDGWVENTAPGESDYHEYDKKGWQLSLNWDITSQLTLDYRYDSADVDTTQVYYQFYQDNYGRFGNERDRRTRTRAPVTPLQPTTTEQDGHGLTLTWNISDSLTLKSISAYRTLEEEAHNNYAGVLYYNGLNDDSVMEQSQHSEELQLIGNYGNLEWIAGLYYFDEHVNKTLQDTFSLDLFGFLGEERAPITPPTTTDLFSGMTVPPRIVDGEMTSRAVYAQATWSPEAMDDKLHLTFGTRFTKDEKDVIRIVDNVHHSKQDIGHIDTSTSVTYDWTNEVSTYLKLSTGYKSGGVNSRSMSFRPFEEEIAETWELGLKSTFWDGRVRFNLAVFQTQYTEMQLDFVDPEVVVITETINAENPVDVDGAEFDFTIAPLEGMLVGISYTYLDTDMPLQPNPLAAGVLQRFNMPLAPQHAGSFTFDYAFQPWRVGTLHAHFDVTSTDHYDHIPSGVQRTDAYTLFNARLTLSDIRFSGKRGAMRLALWGKNLSDEEYIVSSFPVSDPPISIAQAFGTPRTVGVDVTFEF